MESGHLAAPLLRVESRRVSHRPDYAVKRTGDEFERHEHRTRKRRLQPHRGLGREAETRVVIGVPDHEYDPNGAVPAKREPTTDERRADALELVRGLHCNGR